jgi:hypothetical protein
VNKEFESRFDTALQEKLDIDSPTFAENIEDNLNHLLGAARSGSPDAVLSAFLEHTEDGAYVGSEPLLNNQKLLEGTPSEEKKGALRRLANRLSELQKAGVKPELVGEVLSKLQELVQ